MKVRARRSGFTLIELTAVFAVILILIALLLPAIQQSREAARRIQCQNNLRQIGVALANYYDAFEVFPPGTVNDTGPIESKEKGYHMSWIVQILPHLGFSATFKRIDFATSVYSKGNAQWADDIELKSVLACPSSLRMVAPISRYAGIHHHVQAPIDVDNTGVLFLNSSVTREDITDGDSHTLLVGERLVPRSATLTWMSGTAATLCCGRKFDTVDDVFNNRVPLWPQPKAAAAESGDDEQIDPLLLTTGLGSFHGPGVNVLCCDGAVRTLSWDVNQEVVELLAHRSDGQHVSGF